MSDPGPSPTENTGSPKKKVSPTRNLIGLIVLVVVLAVAGFQYAALIRYTVAVKALDARALDDDKGLMTNQEADSLLDKAPDGPGSDFTEEGRRFTKKTYTWQGPLKSFTLTAYYTNGVAAFLHHFEAQGEKYAPKWSPATTSVPPIRISKGKGRSKKKKGASTAKGDANTATVPGKVTAPAAGGEPSKAAAAQATAAGPADEPPKLTTNPAPAPAKPGAPPAEPSKDAPAASEPR